MTLFSPPPYHQNSRYNESIPDCFGRDPRLSDVSLGTLRDMVVLGKRQGETLFTEVHPVAPGHDVKGALWWHPPAPNSIQVPDPPAHFLKLLRQSVETCLEGHTEVVVSMSGGLDSTALAALAAEVLGPKNVHAITFGYEWRKTDPEPAIARRLAEEFGLRWTFLAIDPTVHLPRKPKPWLWHPTGSRSDVIIRYDAIVGNRLVFEGHGGDPLFKGQSGFYPWSLQTQGVRKTAHSLAQALQVQPLAPGLGIRSAFAPKRFRTMELRSKYLLEQPRPFEPPSMPQEWENHPRQDMIRGMLGGIWHRHFASYYQKHLDGGPEYKWPLFDQDLFEFVVSLSPIPWALDKHLLREAMKGILPDYVRLRPKCVAGWFPNHLLTPQSVEWASDVLQEANFAAGVFDIEACLADLQPGIQPWEKISQVSRVVSMVQWLNYLESLE